MSSTWDLNDVKSRIKDHEGYRDSIYSDSLGFSTIGYGHLITKGDSFVPGKRYDRKILEKVFEYDFAIAKRDMELCLVQSGDQPNKVKEIILEMCFQMGRTRVMKFKKMFQAIKNKQYKIAQSEMMDSVWASQTFRRASDLASIMGEV